MYLLIVFLDRLFLGIDPVEMDGPAALLAEKAADILGADGTAGHLVKAIVTHFFDIVSFRYYCVGEGHSFQ